MDSLIGEFESLKISALTKAKSINKLVHNVTIGPNSTFHEEKSSPKVQINKKYHTKKNLKTSSPSKNYELSREKVLLEAEIKAEANRNFQERFDKFVEADKQIKEHSKSEWARNQNLFIEQLNQQDKLFKKMLEEVDKKHSQESQLHYQKQAEERNRRNLELQKQEEENRQRLRLIESIQKMHHQFCLDYEEILEILKEHNSNIINDPVKCSTLNTFTFKLKQCMDIIDKIRDKCKLGIATSADENTANSIVKDAAKLKEHLHAVLEKKKEDEIKAQKIENPPSLPPPPPPTVPATIQQIKPVEPPVTLQPPSDTTDHSKVPPLPSATQTVKPLQISTVSENPVKPESGKTEYGTKESLINYTNLQKYLQDYENKISQITNDEKLKKFKFNCQKAVNVPLNAISAVSESHLLDKYEKLSNLLRGNPVEVGDNMFAPSQHPEGISYCTYLLAQKFVLQGDLLISSNPNTAHSYAAIIVALWHDFPDFGQLVLAHFYKTIPALAPFYPPKLSGQSDADFYISLGYKYNNGEVEKHDKYLKRMSGTMRLYTAILISKLKRGQQGVHPHGLIYGWKWIANILNLEPRSDITSQLLYDFLDIAGNSMLAAYGNQFKKLLTFIIDVYLEKIQNVDSGPPGARLEAFLLNIKTKRFVIDPPKGIFPDGFWFFAIFIAIVTTGLNEELKFEKVKSI